MSSDDYQPPNVEDTISETDSYSSASQEPPRPNRWAGAPSTWRTLTSDERGLAASLDSLRDRDLGIHLYNSHALKRKAREVKEAEKSGGQLNIPEQDDTKGFVPEKHWTAWPLPPEDVPRLGDKIHGRDNNEGTLGSMEGPWPSSAMEDVLMGITLRIAKQRFRRRTERSPIAEEHDSEGGGSIEEGDSQDMKSEAMHVGINKHGVRGNSTASKPPVSGQIQIDVDEEDDSGSEHASDDPGVQMSIEKPQKVFLKPVVSADDHHSRQLIRPSIRHTLSKLDEALMALHHARTTCRYYAGREDTTSEEDGRASSADESADRQTAEPSERSESRFRENPTPRRESVASRRPDSSPNSSSSPAPSPRSSLPQKRSYKAAKEGLDKRRNKNLGLRDWSEVLGAAALVGFNPQVIERATKRCAALFGESMTLHSFIETPYSEPLNLSTTYSPALIPDLDSDFGADSDDSLSSADFLPKPESHKKKASHLQNFFCPVNDCSRNTLGFRDQYKLKRHLKGIHKINEKEYEDHVLPSDEEMDGAVHVDGFMKAVKPTKQKKKRKVDEGKDQDMDKEGSKSKRVGKVKARRESRERGSSGSISISSGNDE